MYSKFKLKIYVIICFRYGDMEMLSFKVLLVNRYSESRKAFYIFTMLQNLKLESFMEFLSGFYLQFQEKYFI